MASRVIGDALQSLLPAANPPLPPSLVQTALSILAQSRTRAGSLKPEEEIARPYVCAHMACERLKTSLDLPPITPRPPCAPKSYQALYTHFSTLLAQRKRGRPRKGEEVYTDSLTVVEPIVPPVRPLQPVDLPEDKAALPARGRRSTGQASRSTKISAARKDIALPVWLVKTVRSLCRTLGTPNAIPHVLAGISTVGAGQGDASKPAKSQDLNLADSPSSKPSWQENLLALAVEVYLLVVSQMNSSTSSESDTIQRRHEILDLLGKDSTATDAGSTIDIEDLVQWQHELESKNWVEEAWFQNIKGMIVPDDKNEEEATEDNQDAEDEDLMGHMSRGLGTMMQDKVDFLSETRRREYLEWKFHILARIDAIQNRNIQSL
ncbi:MAG: hypothetical protein M1814_000194 [Vezdaea aestivalis]|nr:MAG: hypothetical protein M1814_000194 [Vezdaea aestivalis]